MRPIVISLDAMGGDHGVATVVPGALDAVARDASLELILVGDEAVLAPLIAAAPPAQRARLSIVHASQTVAMDESPADALRRKKDSSMRVAIDLVKDGRAQACVSAGNTGALMATAKFVLKTLPGIDRPALISAIPSVGGHTHMLDLGANADCSSEQLYQFAVMGSVLASAVYGIERPTIGLLNIGSEEIKGNEVIKQAAQLIQAAGQLNYIGFVEGNDIFSAHVDVVVADGFAGNVALKTAEGLAKMVARFLREEFQRNIFTKIAALISLPVLKNTGKRLDPRRYNGASLLGLNGIVVKSHGSADPIAFGYAIRVAKLEVENQVPTRIAEQLGRHMNGGVVAAPGARMIYSRIAGTGRYLPENCVTNADLEKRVDTTDAWIRERTGIERRHIAVDGETTLDLCEKAARNAMEMAGLKAEDLDMIAVGTTTPDQVFPNMGVLLQDRLGAHGCMAMGLEAACTGFIYALGIADKFVKTGTVKNALVVGAETLSRIVDWNDRGTCVLFGDGAGAVVITAADEPGIINTHLHADGAYKDLLFFPTGVSKGFDELKHGRSFVQMKGNEVFKVAVKTLASIVDETLEKNGLKPDDIDWLVPHQANIRIIEATARKLGMPMERVVVTVQDHGNTSAASVPMALDVAVRDGRIKRGDTLLLEAFGGGFTWGSALVRY